MGLGWNAVEYEALGEDFHTRGRRLEEQVELLRRLWTEPLVTFTGQWHTIADAGLNPLPIQRPIPLWFGASAESAIRRAARLADGWMMTGTRSADEARPSLDLLERWLHECGRWRSHFGVEARMVYRPGDASAWPQQVRACTPHSSRFARLASGAFYCAIYSGDSLRSLQRFALVRDQCFLHQ